MAARKRILYAFTGGRSARFREIEAGCERPTEFLYGYCQLRARYDVEMIEGDAGGASQATRVDHVLNHLAARVVGLGINTPAYLVHLPRLQSCDALVAVPDSVALAFARLKFDKRAADVPLVYVAMGLASRLQQRPLGFGWWRRYYEKLLSACDAVVVLGRGEHEFLRELFPVHAARFHFIPFGVDTTFWRPDDNAGRDGSFLFVGNDPNRDFELVRSIVKRRPDLRFRIVSSNSRLLLMRAPNAEVSEGDWRRQTLSDEEMRRLFQRSAAVILPLKPSLQPSGQSVALQAVACGTPVVITRTPGFWDPARWMHNEHCHFVEGERVEAWSAALDEVAGNGGLRAGIASRALALVRSEYSANRFAERLAEVLEQLPRKAH